MNTMFSTEYCYGIYAESKKEAFEKARKVIAHNTRMDCSERQFVEFENPQIDSLNERERYIELLIKSSEIL
ncbi:hypothetical protein LG296_21145 (plasmid) [Ureibacillus chungkukjangi]|uniref:hypothetical protein n=1 Tax=Ureibacillus chungkukjangi TaxID=1202712 RepID=UPI000D372BDE|nr:hypothetical protein [Ureibacillus chungkukjangi]MCM3390195.1 hypothetical protein [Ureibacillus chungkukjangi]